jgi:hypothetical protein
MAPGHSLGTVIRLLPGAGLSGSLISKTHQLENIFREYHGRCFLSSQVLHRLLGFLTVANFRMNSYDPERKPMKPILLSALLIAALFLAACISPLATTVPSTSNTLPAETRLAVGTLKLAGTGQEVSAAQAEQLLILWQTYQQLSQSDTAAQAEVDGLVAQIQETLTAEQRQAIAEMQISHQDVAASMQGVTVAASSPSKSTVSVPSGSMNGAGGPPPGGGGAPADGGMPADMGGAAPASGTGQTQSAQSGSSSQSLTQVPAALVQAVIQSLEQKAAA